MGHNTSTWLPGVWGDINGPEFDSMEQAGHITELILRHMNSIAHVFLHTPQEFKPLFIKVPGLDTDNAAEDWCYGFLYVMASQKSKWDVLIKSKAGVLMTPVMTLGIDYGQGKIRQAENPAVERQGWIDLLVKSMIAVHGYWREQLHSMSTNRDVENSRGFQPKWRPNDKARKKKRKRHK